VPKTFRIIERERMQVNGLDRLVAVSGAACLVILTLACVVACGVDESRARRLHEQARVAVEKDELARAVELYDRILADYPDTETARNARREAVLYRGLSQAETTYPARSARDQIVQTARALQRHRDRKRAWPDTLTRLVPDQLDRFPWDPWGRELVYEAKPRKRGYYLACYGADGVPGGQGDDADWLVEDGAFVDSLSKSLK
jgi:hypothetical protein